MWDRDQGVKLSYISSPAPHRTAVTENWRAWCWRACSGQAGRATATFLDTGRSLQRLLQKITVPVDLAEFAAQVLTACAAGGNLSGTAEKLIPVFSGKEERVAQLLAAGLSNNEIAARLFVSPNTIKFHVKSLYRKLGVSKRFDAIQKMHD